MPVHEVVIGIGNKFDIFVENFHAASDIDTAITNATLVFNLYDKDGVVVSGASTISVTHEGAEGPPDTRGNYRGTATPTGLTAKAKYLGVLTSSSHGGRWVQHFRAEEREFNL